MRRGDAAVELIARRQNGNRGAELAGLEPIPDAIWISTVQFGID
jgi:hypothetical protein